MSLLRSVLGLLLGAGLSWDPLKSGPTVPDHSHTYGDLYLDTPSLVQLAESLGGGIYPGMGSGQNDTVGTNDSIAPGFPLNVPYIIPSNTVKQQRVLLSFIPDNYRTYNLSSGNGTTGNGSAAISGIGVSINVDATIESGPHHHRMLTYQANVGADAGTQWQRFIGNDATGGISHDEQIWLHTDNGIGADLYTDTDQGS